MWIKIGRNPETSVLTTEWPDYKGLRDPKCTGCPADYTRCNEGVLIALGALTIYTRCNESVLIVLSVLIIQRCPDYTKVS